LVKKKADSLVLAPKLVDADVSTQAISQDDGVVETAPVAITPPPKSSLEDALSSVFASQKATVERIEARMEPQFIPPTVYVPEQTLEPISEERKFRKELEFFDRKAEERGRPDPEDEMVKIVCLNCRKPTWTHNLRDDCCEECCLFLREVLYQDKKTVQVREQQGIVNPLLGR
jgi:hypothetical protein